MQAGVACRALRACGLRGISKGWRASLGPLRFARSSSCVRRRRAEWPGPAGLRAGLGDTSDALRCHNISLLVPIEIAALIAARHQCHDRNYPDDICHTQPPAPTHIGQHGAKSRSAGGRRPRHEGVPRGDGEPAVPRVVGLIRGRRWPQSARRGLRRTCRHRGRCQPSPRLRVRGVRCVVLRAEAEVRTVAAGVVAQLDAGQIDGSVVARARRRAPRRRSQPTRRRRRPTWHRDHPLPLAAACEWPVHVLPELGQFWPLWADIVSQTSERPRPKPDLGHMLARVGQLWPNNGKHRTALVEVGQIMGRCRPNSYSIWRASAKCRRMWAAVWPSLANIGQ